MINRVNWLPNWIAAMLHLKLSPHFRRERPSDQQTSDASAPVRAAAGNPAGPLSRFHVLVATSLASGLVGGLAPAVFSPQIQQVFQTAEVARDSERLQKLEAGLNAKVDAVEATARANGELAPQLDVLEKRLAKLEQAKVDMNPTSAIKKPAAKLKP